MRLATELRGSTLLIVDDKPQNLRLLSDFLAEQGFELMLTRSGAQALEKARLATPDLVLLDLRMPEMDGFEVCRRLKADATTADIPIIFMTAEDDIKAKVEGFALGAVDYITKPVQREELVARIQHHLQLLPVAERADLQDPGAVAQEHRAGGLWPYHRPQPEDAAGGGHALPRDRVQVQGRQSVAGAAASARTSR